MYLFALYFRMKANGLAPAGPWTWVSDGFSDDPDVIPDMPRGPLTMIPESAVETRTIREAVDVVAST